MKEREGRRKIGKREREEEGEGKNKSLIFPVAWDGRIPSVFGARLLHFPYPSITN